MVPLGTFSRGLVAFHSNIQTISISYIENTTLDAGEKTYEVVGRAKGMSLDGIGELCDRAYQRKVTGDL